MNDTHAPKNLDKNQPKIKTKTKIKEDDIKEEDDQLLQENYNNVVTPRVTVYCQPVHANAFKD